MPDLPPAKQKTVVQFLNEDATKRDWSDADMWFANSTCFDEAVRCAAAIAAHVRPLTVHGALGRS